MVTSPLITSTPLKILTLKDFTDQHQAEVHSSLSGSIAKVESFWKVRVSLFTEAKSLSS